MERIMKDYAWKDRQWIIHGPDAPKAMYKRLIKDFNCSEYLAQQISGYHPIDELDKFLRRFAWTLILVCAGILLFLYTNATNAGMDIPGYQRTETALIECLNGGVLRFDNGEEFMCWRMK